MCLLLYNTPYYALCGRSRPRRQAAARASPSCGSGQQGGARGAEGAGRRRARLTRSPPPPPPAADEGDAPPNVALSLACIGYFRLSSDMDGTEYWAHATASAFNVLTQEESKEVARSEWWNDEGLKALSARVVRPARAPCCRAKPRAASRPPSATATKETFGLRW
eukprot:scaffold74580_cov63-Phaeocystis_antarctica.AAC.3